MERDGLNALFKSRPADAIPPSGYDLWALYRSVRAQQPRVCVEFGAGSSTLLIAETLRRNGGGHLYSYEANARWAEQINVDLPAHLKPFVTIMHTPVSVTEHKGEMCHVHSGLLARKIDFLFLDGPHPSDIPGWPQGVAEVAVDPLLLEPNFNDRFRMIVDARLKNLDFLKRHLTRRYKIKHHDIFKWTTFDLASA